MVRESSEKEQLYKDRVQLASGLRKYVLVAVVHYFRFDALK